MTRSEPICDLNCPVCGQTNKCGVANGECYDEGIGLCWCMKKPHPKEFIEFLRERHGGGQCLCRDCLEKLYENWNASDL